MQYRLYNHIVDSNISLERFGLNAIEKNSLSGFIKIDFIKINDVPGEFVNHQTYSDKSYGYYYVENIALFEVFSGNKIVVNCLGKVDDDLVHTLLNYPFAILFNQRRKFVIHASSVFFNNKVFCFCGKTQSGKSSLASYLIKNGGYLISEDTCVFDYKDGIFSLLPSYNFIKISDDINAYKNSPFLNPINFFKKSTNRKGYVLKSDKFYSKPAIVDYFIYLHWSNEHSVIKKLNIKNSIERLFSNEFISYSPENAAFKFKSVLKLASQADHFLYSRKKELNTLDNFFNIFVKKSL